MSKSRVLFLCTGNSARSQIAEGLVNHFLAESWEAVSAGTAVEGAEIEMEEVAPQWQCEKCGAAPQDNTLDAACPECGGRMIATGGTELIVEEIELHEKDPD